MFKTSEIEHPYTTVSTTAYKNVNTIRAKADIKNFFIVRYQLCFRRKSGYIPYRARGVYTGGNDQTW